ncbi:hypothetical protein [Luteolibacter soli]
MNRSSRSEASGLELVFAIAGTPAKQWALVTASLPRMTADEDRRANATLRQELRTAGLDYWLVFAEWKETPGDWKRFAFVDGTGHSEFQAFVCSILRRHRQPAALVAADGQASVINGNGAATKLGALDIQSAVAAYGRALGGTGNLKLVRAFVPVGLFGTTVRRR